MRRLTGKYRIRKTLFGWKILVECYEVVCDLRQPNSLCRNCKTFKPKYPSYCCQKCGEYIGWLGRFIEWICCGFIKHECKLKTKN